jgi:hypothetical protein
MLLHNKRVTLIEELYFDQAFGSAAQGARYLQPWTMLQLRFTPKFTNETVYFPYLPLNSSGRIQQVLERSKFEYAVKKTWKAGMGYGGYRYAVWNGRISHSLRLRSPVRQATSSSGCKKFPAEGKSSFAIRSYIPVAKTLPTRKTTSVMANFNKNQQPATSTGTDVDPF